MSRGKKSKPFKIKIFCSLPSTWAFYRSALQISMAENNQLKAGQLIPNSSGSQADPSGLDQMFNGLGLDSYIGKKDTG